VIEPAAARLAAQRATPRNLAALEGHLAAMDDAVDDPEAYIAADLRFHAEILAACGNELLEQLGGTLRAVFRASRTLTTRVPGSSARAMPLHRAVATAIRARDRDAAEQAMLALIDRTARDVARALRKPR
jgi:DNA-binding FadR family transcriptional regulator